jgi:hypothetical protein
MIRCEQEVSETDINLTYGFFLFKTNDDVVKKNTLIYLISKGPKITSKTDGSAYNNIIKICNTELSYPVEVGVEGILACILLTALRADYTRVLVPKMNILDVTLQ